jgi:hypothetical protein
MTGGKSFFYMIRREFFGILPLGIHSQNVVLQQALYCARITVRWQMNTAWSLQAEAENRRFMAPSEDQQLFVTHLYATYQSKASVGITYGDLNTQIPDANKSSAELYEIRPWQSYTQYLGKWGKWTFSQRLRVEERLFFQPGASEQSAKRRTALRGRYLVQARRLLTPHWTGFCSEELLLQTGRNIEHGFDQNRVMLGLEYRLNDHFNIETSYTWWWQLRQTGSVVYDRDVWRVTLGARI